MRRSLIITVAASVSVVLLAMLVPMAVLVRSYALEDRLSRAALEVQATETVVSGQDKGAVSVYLARVNRNRDIQTTVLYPDGVAVGPHPGEDALVRQARRTGRARVDDIAGGTQILVPVSRGGNSALPALTPVIRVEVRAPALISQVHRAWLVLAVLGLVLLGGALLLADRLGRSFVGPIRALANYTAGLGGDTPPAPVVAGGPTEVRELGEAVNRLVGRIELLLAREREAVSDLSHRLRTPVTALRLRIEAVTDDDDRDRLSGDLDELEAMVDQIVREARRSEREGVDPRTDAVAVLAERAQFWQPLADDQNRPFTLVRAPGPPVLLGISAADLSAVVDVLLDNVFSHTPEAAPVSVTVTGSVTDGSGAVVLVVEDGGPGFPPSLEVADRGTSGRGSTGLGLAIVARTAAESGGTLSWDRSSLGGARVQVRLGSG